MFRFARNNMELIDTFDMKPDAPAEIRGVFQPISTRTPGVQICGEDGSGGDAGNCDGGATTDTSTATAATGATAATASCTVCHGDQLKGSDMGPGMGTAEWKKAWAGRSLGELFDKIKQMKHRNGYPVVNPTESLNEMQRHLRGEKEQFGCLGGHKYFYLDWNLDLYRCHAWDKPMCKVYEWDDSKLIRDGCTKCMIDCYRDPSVLQHVAINVSDAWHALRKGDVGTAAMKVLDSKNVTSLKAVWEDRKWIAKTFPVQLHVADGDKISEEDFLAALLPQLKAASDWVDAEFRT